MNKHGRASVIGVANRSRHVAGRWTTTTNASTQAAAHGGAPATRARARATIAVPATTAPRRSVTPTRRRSAGADAGRVLGRSARSRATAARATAPTAIGATDRANAAKLSPLPCQSTRLVRFEVGSRTLPKLAASRAAKAYGTGSA